MQHEPRRPSPHRGPLPSAAAAGWCNVAPIRTASRKPPLIGLGVGMRHRILDWHGRATALRGYRQRTTETGHRGRGNPGALVVPALVVPGLVVPGLVVPALVVPALVVPALSAAARPTASSVDAMVGLGQWMRKRTCWSAAISTAARSAPTAVESRAVAAARSTTTSSASAF